MITKVFHLADIHIRKGNFVDSRFSEYSNVFDNTINKLLELYIPEQSICVICGDIFHHKLQISSHGIVLFNKLFYSIADIMPLFVIQGNHDLLQESSDDNNDMILALLKNHPHKNIFYYDKTTCFDYDNIHFGLVSIRDMLKYHSGSGLVDDLPDFPLPSSTKFNIALSHATVQNCLLHNYTKTTTGIPVEWFSGYNLVLLGDIHLQSAKYSKKHDLYYGYPGSLVQQDFGEGLFNHGLLVWNLDDTGTKVDNVEKIHIYNSFGRGNLKMLDNEIFINSCNYESFEDFLIRTNIPKELHLRLYCKENTDIHAIRESIENSLSDNGIDSRIDIITSAMLDNNEKSACDFLNSSLSNLRSSDTLIEFLKQNCKEEILNLNPNWESYFKNIETVKLKDYSIFSNQIKELIDSKNAKLDKKINTLTNNIASSNVKNHLHIINLSFDWILAYGNENIFNFSNNKITLINAPNGYGKSAFFECITLGLFGETIPSRYNRSTSLSIINCKKPFNKNNEVSRIKVTFKINNKIYTINRDFHEYTQNKKQRLHSLIVQLYEGDKLLFNSTKTVNNWVNDNICTLSDFLLSTMITQNFDNDFFKLKPSEQNDLLDSVLNMKSINETNDIIKESKKEYKDLKNHVDTFINAIKPKDDFNYDEYNSLVEESNTLSNKLDKLQEDDENIQIIVKQKSKIRDDIQKPERKLDEILNIEKELETKLNNINLTYKLNDDVIFAIVLNRKLSGR